MAVLLKVIEWGVEIVRHIEDLVLCDSDLTVCDLRRLFADQLRYWLAITRNHDFFTRL
jgi:hypothetical protein